MAISTTGASQSFGLCVSTDGAKLDVRLAERTHHATPFGDPVGATYGCLTDAESEAIMRALAASADPGRNAPEIPWAAVVQRPDGTTVATCSTMLGSGLFYSIDETARGLRQLVVATDPGQVVAARPIASTVNDDYIVGRADRRVGLRTTPFDGVRRLPPGDSLLWRPGDARGTVLEWCGPTTAPEPVRSGSGVIQDYLTIFDSVVETLASRSGPRVVGMSAGLDSTFLVASLARVAGPEIQALCHSPLPQADYPERPGWVVDDFPLAQSMAQRYPGRVQVTALRNTELVHPLDAAARAAEASWIPAFSPANQVWMNQIQDVAESAGARFQWYGSHGNAAFSRTHSYARSYARTSWRQRFRRRSPARGSARAQYVNWLTQHHGGHGAALNPAGLGGVDLADPFKARSVIEFAASVSPREWLRGAPTRAFARRAGAGRMPDEITGRTRRGAQAWDSGAAWLADPARLREAWDRARATPLLAAVVDWDEEWAGAQEWSAANFPPTTVGIRVEGLLTLADYLQDIPDRLSRWNAGLVGD